MRLLLWFLSTAIKSGSGPACSVSEAFTAFTTSELKGTTAQASMSSTTCQVSAPPPVLPVLDILAVGTPVGHLFSLALSLKHRNQDCCPNSTPEGQSSKRAHAVTEGGSLSSGCSTPPSGQQLATAPNNQSLRLAISPSVQSRLQLTPMTS